MALLRLPALLCLGSTALLAQSVGSLTGTVTDTTGRPLHRVMVRALSPALMGGERTTHTDHAGRYRFFGLPPGDYSVTFLKDGFLSQKATGRLASGQTLSTDITLREISAMAACVEVVATGLGGQRSSTSRAFSSRASSSYAPAAQTAATVVVQSAPSNTEQYNRVEDGEYKLVARDPLSTFSIDVDTASYSNLRRYLSQGQLPPKDAVRIEEMLNYFQYTYAEPRGEHPFSVATELLDCPWQSQHKLLRLGLQAKRMKLEELPPRNLVFLIDVSGSMSSENKLPLVKQGLSRLCENLRKEDHVAMVVYAGSSGLVLPPTSGQDKHLILEALSKLGAGGSTHGAAGIQQAYQVAREQFQNGSDNRVLLCTDGDFNVGVSDQGSLVRLVEEQRKSGVFLTCLGFGMGNLKDGTLEHLADKGNGHYAYIDTLPEMEKVFGAGGASLVTVAKDVKLQLEFNPSKVQAYRLIGYENRALAAADFNNDAKDAGEMNAGHSVTALYELVPTGVAFKHPKVDALKYQTTKAVVQVSPELATVKVRYKTPEATQSRRLELPVADQTLSLADCSQDARWAAAVATFGMVLRDSPHKGKATLDLATNLGRSALGKDPQGHRAEFLSLIGKARTQRAQ